MERIIKKDDFGDIACNDIVIYSVNRFSVGKLNDSNTNWKVIEPKYYIYKEDDSMVEIWDGKTGVILDNGLNKKLKIGQIGKWAKGSGIEITYEQAMKILNKDLGYNNKDLMSRIITNSATAGLDPYELEKKNGEPRFDITKAIEKSKGNICCEIGIEYARDDLIDTMAFHIYENELKRYKKKDEDDKQNNNGGASDWYYLPKDAKCLQDLIEHRNMNGSVKDIFKACYRLGIKTEDELRDLNKMAYYSLREVGRITGRKDYITIAKELMGSQADEKDENDI